MLDPLECHSLLSITIIFFFVLKKECHVVHAGLLLSMSPKMILNF